MCACENVDPGRVHEGAACDHAHEPAPGRSGLRRLDRFSHMLQVDGESDRPRRRRVRGQEGLIRQDGDRQIDRGPADRPLEDKPRRRQMAAERREYPEHAPTRALGRADHEAAARGTTLARRRAGIGLFRVLFGRAAAGAAGRFANGRGRFGVAAAMRAAHGRIHATAVVIPAGKPLARLVRRGAADRRHPPERREAGRCEQQCTTQQENAESIERPAHRDAFSGLQHLTVTCGKGRPPPAPPT